MDIKHCNKCGLDKPVSEFWKHRTEGYQAYCKSCGDAHNRAYKRANPEKMREARKAAYWKDPEKARAAKRNLSQEERLRKNAAAREYRKANPEKVRWWNKLRLHRNRAAGAMPDRWHFSWLLCHQDARCTYCKTVFFNVRYEIDHKIPVSRGGTNDPENLQLLCPTCNMKKSKKTHDEYMKQLKRDRLLARTNELLSKQ